MSNEPPKDESTQRKILLGQSEAVKQLADRLTADMQKAPNARMSELLKDF